MKNVLAIEIKDNKTVVTLTKIINDNHNLLLQKVYGSKPLAREVMYDNTIIDQMKEDLSKHNLIDSIDEILLTLNTKHTYVKSYPIELTYNTDIKSKKELLISKIEKSNPEGVKIIDLKISDTDSSLIKKQITIIAEMVSEDYLNEVKRLFKHKGFQITKVVSVIKAIENSTKENLIKNGTTFNILLEEKFTQLSTLKDGKLISSLKWDFGLTNIYGNISEKMNIDKNAAKYLFSAFGSIPPEEVIDNKVIQTRNHGKELEIFTKKDLSKFITEQVNIIFSDLKTEIDKIKEITNIRIVLNGEITSLNGFKKYAAKSFAEPNITKFNSRIIGLNEETEFITVGILGEAKNKIDTNIEGKIQPVEKVLTPKINIFKKLTRMYSYI